MNEIKIDRQRFLKNMIRLRAYVNSWPAWKLETRASQYPRPTGDSK